MLPEVHPSSGRRPREPSAALPLWSPREVNALDPSADGTALFASSMGQRMAIFDGRQWQTANVGMAEHAHGGVSGIHVDSATDVGQGTVYAGTILTGIAVSRAPTLPPTRTSSA
jgi:hypothetical protein